MLDGKGNCQGKESGSRKENPSKKRTDILDTRQFKLVNLSWISVEDRKLLHMHKCGAGLCEKGDPVVGRVQVLMEYHRVNEKVHKLKMK